MLHNLISTDDAPDVAYLFQSESSVIEFVVIDEEMAQLNDYCCLCADATATKISGLTKLADDIDAGRIKAWCDFDVVHPIRDIQLPHWANSHQVLVPGMSLLLLAAFLEKSLCWLAERPHDKPTFRKGKPRVLGYIEFLQGKCGLAFEVPPETDKALELFRVLRNAFAHGDWEDFQQRLQGVDLTRVFGAVAALFRQIENAYIVKSQSST